MTALIYLILAACVGDFFCRRFYQFESVAHRCAAAILAGLLISSWFTYLTGLAFFWTSRPMVWANLLFFTAAIAVLSWPRWKRRREPFAHCTRWRSPVAGSSTRLR